MADLSQLSCCLYDYSDNFPLARRLAREFGKVRYYRHWKDANPESTTLSVGTGYQDVERVRHFEEAINKTDLFIFPNIYDGSLQRDLVNRGKRVWGSRYAERLEYDRELFIKTIERLGLPVPEYHICYGIDQLAEFLQQNDDYWIKCNLRGDDDTWRHKTWDRTQRRIELMRHQYGPIGNDIVFTCVAHIDSTTEAAYDGFMVTSPDGKPQFPQVGFLGYEAKNVSHILRALPYDDFPELVREVNDVFAPEAAAYYMRSGFGTEIKIVEDEETEEQTNYFLDFTARQPSPPGEIIMEQVVNLGEFFYEGAEGNLIPLEIEKEFGIQIALYSECSKTGWSDIKFPKEIDRWVKLSRCCWRDGKNQFIPKNHVTIDGEGLEHIGDVVALGNTIEGAISLGKEYCEAIDGDGLTNEVDSLVEVLRRIHEGEKQGIPFAEEVPDPEEVIAEV